MAGIRVTVLCGLLLPAWGCDSAAPPPPPTPSQDGASPAPIATAQRPTRTYYMAHTAGRCTVYWVDGQAHSVSRPEPCPRELEPGERVRLAGRVCMRESDNPAREGPMRCPQPLVESAVDDRRDAGEMRLAPAGSATVSEP